MAEESEQTQGEALGAVVRAAREAKGWSLRETAPKIDVTWQWLQRMERGAFHQPDASRMARLVGLLDIDPQQLSAVSGDYIPDALRCPTPSGICAPSTARRMSRSLTLSVGAKRSSSAH